MGKNRATLVMVLIGILVVILVLITINYHSQEKSLVSGKPAEQEILSNEPEETTEQVIQNRCPLDGAPVDELSGRPVVVTIDNLFSARPQSGLNKADLVYEVPAEGGVTRFLAVFYHGRADKIGPVRSARPYFIDIAREWDGIYIHCGESPQAQAYFKKGNVDHINEMFNPQGFWRDKSRKAPHNLYTSSDNLTEQISKRGWDRDVDVPGFVFAEETDETAGPGENEVVDEISIAYLNSNVVYKYDPASEIYQRFIDDKPHRDRETGEQLTAANILVQEVAVRVFDQEGRLEVDLIGTGNAYLFSAGQALKGLWKKDAVSEPTSFSDLQGNPFKMHPGQTWILVVPKDTVVAYKTGSRG